MSDTVPRRLVLRTVCDLLQSQADRLDDLASDRTHGLGGPHLGERQIRRARSHRDAKSVGRAAEAERLRSIAKRIDGWLRNPTMYKGGGIDHTLFGLVLAVIAGHSESWGPLCEDIVECGFPPLPEGVKMEMVDVILSHILAEG